MSPQLQLEVTFFAWQHGAGRGGMICFPTWCVIGIVI